MHFLSLEERVELAAFCKRAVNDRIPVIASGHVSQSREDQLAELEAVAGPGVDGLVLVTNRLDADRQGGSKFTDDLDWLLARLPQDLPPRPLRMPRTLSAPAERR
jgi:4-hydroxy-tetrahydrodipicolinate synthase